VLKLDQIQTVAFAGLILFLGYGIRRLIPLLGRYNIPAPVIGGLVVAGAITAARAAGQTLFTFDTALQTPLMIAFFTTIGFGASVQLLRVGGPAVLIFFIASTVAAVLQNVIGAGAAVALGQHPLLGVLAGSVTLTGGPATGLAFAPLFEQAGVPGAATVAVAAAMAGIVSGSVIGGPVGTWLVARAGRSARPQAPRPTPAATDIVEAQVAERAAGQPEGEDADAYRLLKTGVLILLAMWAGSWVTQLFASLDITLPAYIGAMLVAALLRNIDDFTGVFGLSQRLVDDLGTAALSLFLVLALMTLRLWELVGLAVPLLIMLVLQVVMVALLAGGPLFRLMGKDYEAAVMSGGFIGFMLGTTANAMAIMNALVERYGPAPKAFLVAPMVGAFFIDFTNALLITICLNLFA
jgi:ESS family glutamate:Na+ symporter